MQIVTFIFYFMHKHFILIKKYQNINISCSFCIEICKKTIFYEDFEFSYTYIKKQYSN